MGSTESGIEIFSDGDAELRAVRVGPRATCHVRRFCASRRLVRHPGACKQRREWVRVRHPARIHAEPSACRARKPLRALPRQPDPTSLGARDVLVSCPRYPRRERGWASIDF